MQQDRTIIAIIQQQLRPALKQGHTLEDVLGSLAVGPIGGMRQHAHQPCISTMMWRLRLFTFLPTK